MGEVKKDSQKGLEQERKNLIELMRKNVNKDIFSSLDNIEKVNRMKSQTYSTCLSKEGTKNA